MKHCTPKTPAVKPQYSAEFFTNEPDGREWMIAFASEEQPTAQELRDLLGGVAHDLEVVDAEGCDEAEVEIVEPARGHDCALLVRSSYVELTCTVLGMVVKRLADAGVQFAHQGCWPSKPVEIQEAQYRNRARDPEVLRQCAEQKANIAQQLLDEAKALMAQANGVQTTISEETRKRIGAFGYAVQVAPLPVEATSTFDPVRGQAFIGAQVRDQEAEAKMLLAKLESGEAPKARKAGATA